VAEAHISSITDSIVLLRYVRALRRDASRRDGLEDALLVA
jgi:hypothetical protein